MASWNELLKQNKKHFSKFHNCSFRFEKQTSKNVADTNFNHFCNISSQSDYIIFFTVTGKISLPNHQHKASFSGILILSL